MPLPQSAPTRRDFLRTSGVATAALSFPAILRSQGAAGGPNERLNLAFVGVGGRGHGGALTSLKDHNLVAFCDVDDARAAAAYKAFPQVPRFRDYRQMLDKLGNRIDGVAVSTPDHMHFPIAMAAMSLGKHVYVEKPMGQTIDEVRRMAKLAREKKVATQMGTQGHSNEGTRLLKEWFDAGVLGEVREVLSWTDRPGSVWPQNVKAPDHKKGAPAVPPTLDWDLWLGVAQPRAYDPIYLPKNWRGFWDFGTGSMGDMGCHMLDGGYWALGLTQPTSLEAVTSPQTEISGPASSVVTYHFPARGARPPVKWTWFDGGLEPVYPAEFEAMRDWPRNAELIIGSKASVLADANYASVRIIPEAKMQGLSSTLPPKTLPRVKDGHFGDWVRACKDGKPAGSDFAYAAQLTETVLLSAIAIRTRRRIEWDAKTMSVTNLPEANRFVRKEYRAGFGV